MFSETELHNQKLADEKIENLLLRISEINKRISSLNTTEDEIEPSLGNISSTEKYSQGDFFYWYDDW